VEVAVCEPWTPLLSTIAFAVFKEATASSAFESSQRYAPSPDVTRNSQVVEVASGLKYPRHTLVVEASSEEALTSVIEPLVDASEPLVKPDGSGLLLPPV
jgi:hypothetical protein